MFALLAVLGIMSALPDEGMMILDHMEDKTVTQIGCKEFVSGTLEGTPIVFSLAGVGKVSAATTATLLASQFNVDGIIFTGVAGGGQGVEIGDIVIGHTYVQHDMDARPIFPQFHIISLNRQTLLAHAGMRGKMRAAADRYFARGIAFPELGIHAPKVHEGVIASGDQFIFDPAHHAAIAADVETVIPGGFHAIEMEGAAVAQVCHELDIPFVIVRAISDKADHSAPVNFVDFTQQIAKIYSYELIKEFLLND
jgi:adenosylhomocysteine nucleosidase